MNLQVGDRVQIQTERDKRGSQFPLRFPANGVFGNVRYIHHQKPCEFCVRVDLDNGHGDGFSLREVLPAQVETVSRIRIKIRREPEQLNRIKIKLRKRSIIE